MTAFYNEIDPYAAQWIRNLIAGGHIAPGVVDERDIRDITAEELDGYSQCHFFAGVAVWGHALRLAQFPSDLKIWSGSCPCQPFSAAGRGAGIADERHLWPHWFWLIEQCRPDLVLGEQVASKDGLGWLDLVSTDMENAGYAFGATDTCAAGVTMEWQDSQSGEWLERAIRDCGDPGIAADLRDFADWAGAGNIGEGGKHIRQRLYFVGLADSQLPKRWPGHFGKPIDDGQEGERIQSSDRIGERSDHSGLADTLPTGRTERRAVAGDGQTAGLCATGRLDDDDDDARPQGLAGNGSATGREGSGGPVAATSVSDGMADAASPRSLSGAYRRVCGGEESGRPRNGEPERPSDAGGLVNPYVSNAAKIDASHDSFDEQRTTERRGSIIASWVGTGSGNCDGDNRPGRSAINPTERVARDDRPRAPDIGRQPVDWLFGRDGKWRAVRSGSFPLVAKSTARVGRLRAYGNGLDARTARQFCEVVKEIIDNDMDF